MAWSIWWRRSWWSFPCALVIMFLVMRNVQPVGELIPGWRANWGWMLGVWNGGTLLLSPFMASLAALVMIREWPRGLRAGVAALPRGRRALVHIVATLWLQGIAAMVVALGIGVVMCLLEGSPIDSATLPWQLFPGAAGLLAAVLLGALLGSLFGDLLVVPVLGFGVFLAHQVFFWSGYPELFTTEVPSWFYEDARPKSSHLAATIFLNLTVGAGIWFFLDWHTRVPGFRPRRLLVAVSVCLAIALAIYLPWVISGNMDTYEPLG